MTINLLRGAMDAAKRASGANAFLIDGFPRNEENRASFERITGETCEFVLYFECPEGVMVNRLLNRGQGRSDDNEATIRKRLNTYYTSSMPVIEHYDRLGKLRAVFSNREMKEVYADVRQIFKTAGF